MLRHHRRALRPGAASLRGGDRSALRGDQPPPALLLANRSTLFFEMQTDLERPFFGRHGMGAFAWPGGAVKPRNRVSGTPKAWGLDGDAGTAKLHQVVRTDSLLEESDCVRCQAGGRVAHKVNSLWDRFKNPGCGLMDNPPVLHAWIGIVASTGCYLEPWR